MAGTISHSRQPTADPRFVSGRAAVYATLAAGVGLAVALGRPALRHNADSLIPVFVSLVDWTPFYWGQDRFGMPLALIAMPVSDGLWNLIVQNAVSVWLLLVGIYALAARLGDTLPEVTSLTTLLALLVWPRAEVELLLLTTNQSYAPALGLLALAVAAGAGTRPSRLVAVTLGAIGSWLNAGVALLVWCIAVVGLMPAVTRPTAMVALFTSSVGLVCHRILQFAATDLVDVTHLTTMPLSEAVVHVLTFWGASWQELAGWAGVPLVGLLIVRAAANGGRYRVAAIVVGGG
jgi:hypothetical protein